MHRLSFIFSVIISTGILSACSAISLAPIADNNARDYHQVVENVTNDILVTNVLRARDRAPIHYSDLSSFNASLTEITAVTATFPFGPLRGSSTRNGFQLGGISLQSNPSFTLGTLDTDDFTRGILTPISGDVIGNFIAQGFVNRAEAFLLFFNSVQDYDVRLCIHPDLDRAKKEKLFYTRGVIRNEPDLDRVTNTNNTTEPTSETELGLFLAIANYEAPGLYVHGYHELRKISSDFNLNNNTVKDLATLDVSKFQIRQDPDSKSTSKNYALYSVSHDMKYVVCSRHPQVDKEKIRQEHLIDNGHGIGYRIFALGPTSLPTRPLQVCTDDEVIIPDKPEQEKIVLGVRSAQGIIEYLGALLRFQQKHPQHGPITVTYLPPSPVVPQVSNKCPQEAPNTAAQQPSGGALFQLTNNPDGARFGVAYRGDTYYVAQASEKDHSLEVLALVNQLLDAYKSAKDIPTIHPVTIVP
jgi:hypothetical protein